MDKKKILKSIGKAFGVAATLYVAINELFEDRKKEKEFEDMKKTLSDLQKNQENP